ncbi:MAG: leucine-rich repeat domain-containing protein [Bacteroidota bacterium]
MTANLNLPATKYRKIAILLISAALIAIYPVTTSFITVQPEYCEDAETYYDLGEALKEPEKVIKLDIAMQKLTQISPDIGKLYNLECLDLSFNRIPDLPPEFANLKKLKYINLTGTRYMPKLPGILKELPNLEVVDLRDHPEWSPAQFEDAKKMLPDVKIITESK